MRFRSFSILFSLVIIALFILTIGCTKKTAPVSEIKPFEAYGILQNNFGILVDVRDEDEIGSGMAEPALWFPASQMEDDAKWKEFVSKLSPSKQIIVYCAGGGRAQKVAEKLAAEGFRASNMGGFDAWVKSGLAVKKP